MHGKEKKNPQNLPQVMYSIGWSCDPHFTEGEAEARKVYGTRLVTQLMSRGIMI